MNEISVNYSPLADKAILALASKVHQAVTTEPCKSYYTAPEPAPAILKAKIDAFAEALALETSVSVTALRKSRRDELTAVLIELAAHLELQAKGDLMKLAATGYELKRKPARSLGPTETPQNLRLATTGITGEVLAKCQPIRGIRTYHPQAAVNPNGPWTDFDPVTNSQKILFTGLERGRDIYIRVRAFGPNGYSGWSDIATIMVV